MASTSIAGSFQGSNKGYYALALDLTSTTDNANNRSNVTGKLYMRRTGSVPGQWSNDGSAKASITINGSSSGEVTVYFDTRSTTDWILLTEYTVNNIGHNNDGTKSISVSATFEPNSTATLYGGAVSGTFTLDTIPRASSVSISNFNMGSNPTITWTPLSNAFKYKTRVVCGTYDSGYTGFISPNRTTSYSYTSINVPLSAASKIGSTAKTLTATVYLITYNSSGTQIGSTATSTSTATLPDNSSTKPVMNSCTITGINLYNGLYLQNQSSVKVVSSIGCKYNATLKSITTYVDGKSIGTSTTATSGALSKVGSNSIKVDFTDSRGYSNSHTAASITVTAYVPPTINDLKCQRWDITTGVANDNSLNVRVSGTISFSPLDGSNTYTVNTYYRQKGSDTWLNGGSASGQITDLAILITGDHILSDYTYEMMVTISDEVGNSNTYYDNVSTSFSLINFTRDALAFGKASEKSKTFECALDTDFSGNTQGYGIVPIGAIVMFSSNAANVPSGWIICDGRAVSRTTYARLFSVVGTRYGTGDGSTTFNVPDMRTRVPAGYKSGDSTFGTLGGSGGSSTHTHTTGGHTLTTSEIPSHSHTATIAANTGTHSHSVPGWLSTKTGSSTMAFETWRYAKNEQSVSISGGGHSHTVTVNNTGSGGSHSHGNTGSSSNVQPFITMYFIIRAL